VIVATASFIAGQRVLETKGHVIGSVVILPALQEVAHSQGRIVGEYGEWTRMFWTFRQQAIDRMVQEATALGANAVISMRLTATPIATVADEIVAYGTAVVLAPDGGAPGAPPPGGY